MKTSSPARARTTLYQRLLARREEITQTVLTRVQALSGPERSDQEYAEGLRVAVDAAVGYGIGAIKQPEHRPPAVPAVLLEQVRRSARRGIHLDSLLRRYLAGYSLLSNFLVEEAEESDQLDGASLRRLLWAQADLFDRLIELVGEEYARELQQHPRSPAERRTERVERLLAGEPLDTFDLNYDLDSCHLGLVTEGEGADEAVQSLVGSLELASIVIHRSDETIWAWLGGRPASLAETIDRRLTLEWPGSVPMAIGEPGAGRAGWRRTHQQAKAAMPIACRSRATFVRYRDVALLSSVSRDDLLSTSLRELYLAPLEDGHEGGGPLVETLRAYFASDRNVSSTAAALGVNRRTVTNRLRVIEDRLGCSLPEQTAEIAAALRLQELDPIVPR
jgi:hypothetical protein